VEPWRLARAPKVVGPSGIIVGDGTIAGKRNPHQYQKISQRI